MDEDYFLDLFYPIRKGVSSVVVGRWDWLWPYNLVMTLSRLQLRTFIVYPCLVISATALLGSVAWLWAIRAKKGRKKNGIVPKGRLNNWIQHSTEEMRDAHNQFTKHVKKYLSKTKRRSGADGSRRSSKVSNETRCLLEWDGNLKNAKRKPRNCQCVNLAQAKSNVESKRAHQDGKHVTLKDVKTPQDVPVKSAIRIDEFGDVTCLATNTTDKNKKQAKENCLDQKQKFKNPNLVLSLHSPPVKETGDESSSSESSSSSSNSDVSECTCSKKEAEIERQPSKKDLDKNVTASPTNVSLKQTLSLQQSNFPKADKGQSTTWVIGVKDQNDVHDFDKTEIIHNDSECTLDSARGGSSVNAVENLGESGDWLKRKHGAKKSEASNMKHIRSMTSKTELKCQLEEDIYNPNYFAPAVGKAKAQSSAKKADGETVNNGRVRSPKSINRKEPRFQDKSPLSKCESPKNKPACTEKLSPNNIGSKFPARCKKKPPRFVINHQAETDYAKDNSKKVHKNDVIVHSNNSLTMQRGFPIKGADATKQHDSKGHQPATKLGKMGKYKFLKRSELRNFYKELQGVDSGNGRRIKNASITDISKCEDRVKSNQKTVEHEKHDRTALVGSIVEQNKTTTKPATSGETKTTQTDLCSPNVCHFRLGPSPEPKPVISEKHVTPETLSPSSNQPFFSPFSTHRVGKSTFCLKVARDKKQLLDTEHQRASDMNDHFLDTRIRELNSYTDSFDASSYKTDSSHKLLAQTAKTHLVLAQAGSNQTLSQNSESQKIPTPTSQEVEAPPTTIPQGQRKEFVSFNNRQTKSILKDTSTTHESYSQQIPSQQIITVVHHSNKNLAKGDVSKDTPFIIKSAGKSSRVPPSDMRSASTVIKYDGKLVGDNERKHKLAGAKSFPDPHIEKKPMISGLDIEPKAKIKRSNVSIMSENKKRGPREDVRYEPLNKHIQDNQFQMPSSTEGNHNIEPGSSPEVSPYDQLSYVVEHPTMATSPQAGAKLILNTDNFLCTTQHKNNGITPKSKQRQDQRMKAPFTYTNGKKTHENTNQESGKIAANGRESGLQSGPIDLDESHEQSSKGVVFHYPGRSGKRTGPLIPSRVQNRLEARLRRGKQTSITNSPLMSNSLKTSKQPNSSSDKGKFLKRKEKITKQSEAKSPAYSKILSPRGPPTLRTAKGQTDNISKTDHVKQLMKAKTKTDAKPTDKTGNDSLAKLTAKTENDSQTRTPSTYQMLHKNRSSTKKPSLLPPKSTREEKNITPKERNEQIQPTNTNHGNKLSQTSQEKAGSKKVKGGQVARRILKGRRMRVVKGGNATSTTPSAQTLTNSRDIETNSKWSDIIPGDTLSSNGAASQERGTLDELLVLNRISYSSVTSVDSKKCYQYTLGGDNVTHLTSSPPKTQHMTDNNNDLGSILSNLAYIEDLNSEEIEKLSLPQHLPDLIATSSGDSAVANCTVRPAKINSRSNNGLRRDMSFSMRHAGESIRLHDDVADDMHEDDSISMDRTMPIDNSASEQDNDNEFENLFFVESLDVPTTIEHRKKELSSVDIRGRLGEYDPLHSEKNNLIQKPLRNRFFNSKLNLSDSKLCKKVSTQKLPRPTSTPFSSRSGGHNFILNAQSQDNSDLQTQKFRNIFPSKGMLQKWAQSNNILRYSQDLRAQPQNFTSNHESIEKESSYELVPEPIVLATQKKAMELDRAIARMLKVSYPSDGDQESAKERTGCNISGQILLSSSESSKDTTKAELENLSWDDCRKISKRQNRCSNQLEGKPVDDRDKITPPYKDKSLVVAEDCEITSQKHTRNIEHKSSSSDVAITWLAERKLDALKRGKPRNRIEAPSHVSLVDDSRERDLEIDLRYEELTTTKINSSKWLSDLKEPEASCSTDTSSTQSSSKKFKEKQTNVFLNMQRVKPQQVKDLPEKTDSNAIRMTSPPKLSRYVKSALSYSKKKHASGGSSAVKCPETYCIEQTSGAEANIPTSSHSNQSPIGGGSDANIQLAKATKNNNKLPISFTSLYYTTQIDAVESDSSMSGRQPIFHRYEVANSDGMSNYDNTSDDVSTAEFSTSWESGRMCVSRAPTEVQDSSFHSAQQNQTGIKSFNLDWYRPKPQHRPTAREATAITTGSEATFGSDSEELDEVGLDDRSGDNCTGLRFGMQRNQRNIDPRSLSHASLVNEDSIHRSHPTLHFGADDASTQSWYAGHHTHLNRTANRRSLISGESSKTGERDCIVGSSKTIYLPQDHTTSLIGDDYNTRVNDTESDGFSTTCHPSYSSIQYYQQFNSASSHENRVFWHAPHLMCQSQYIQSKELTDSEQTSSNSPLDASSAIHSLTSNKDMISYSDNDGGRSVDGNTSVGSETGSFCTCTIPCFDTHNIFCVCKN